MDADLGHLADRAAIADLIARYAFAVDRHDRSELRALFTDHAVLAMYRDGDETGPQPLVKGAAAIAEFIAALADPGGAHHPGPTAHLLGPSAIDIDIDGSRATAQTRCVAHHLVARGTAVRHHTSYLRYEDEFERGITGWQIARRAIRHDFLEDRPAAVPNPGDGR